MTLDVMSAETRSVASTSTCRCVSVTDRPRR
jgi:hypothetical protein